MLTQSPDYHERIELTATIATTELRIEQSATIVKGLLAIPNAHDDNMIDLVTVERSVDFLGHNRERKTCWGSVHIDFFGSYSGPWHKALSDGQAICLDVVEG